MPQLPSPDEVQLWFRYEEIAMHFNTLLMQFRLQVMAGLGAVGTVAGYLVSAKVPDPGRHARLRALIATGFWFLLLSAAAFDVFYYSRLLEGAVVALLDFEELHPAINMSTNIESAVGHGKYINRYVYGGLLFFLALYCVWAWRKTAESHEPNPEDLSAAANGETLDMKRREKIRQGHGGKGDFPSVSSTVQGAAEAIGNAAGSTGSGSSSEDSAPKR